MTVPSPPAAARDHFQGRYAGAVSRFAAYAVDLGVSTGLFLLGLSASAFAITIITSHHVAWNKSSPVVAAIFVVWLFTYFAYSWAGFGKSPGMALLGVRVIRSDGADLDARRAVVRTLAFPLSFLCFGLGFAAILVQRDRRALHDLIAGTAVIYAWDARAARLRFLAGQERPRGAASPPPAAGGARG
jgi:uncharacterized RDD family membrane protein YckC